MKCVDITAEKVELLLQTNFTEDEFQFFKSHKRDFKAMWQEQGSEFWIKFVVAIKAVIVSWAGDPEDHTHEYDVDQCYIDFLDALLCVDYNAVFSYVEETGKAIPELLKNHQKVLSNFRIKLNGQGKAVPAKEILSQMKCQTRAENTAAFVRLFHHWKSAPKGIDFPWDVPEIWYEPPINYTDKLELYIRSKWNITQIEQMFGILRHKICWLRSGNFKGNVKFPPSQPTKPCERIDPNVALRYKSFVTNDESEVKSQELKRVIHPKSLEGPKYANFEPVSLLWLAIPKSPKRMPRNPQEKGTVQLLRQSNNNTMRLWILIETAMPPYLDRRFHKLDIQDIINTNSDSHFMECATSFVLWCESLGLQYLHGIHEKHDDLEKLMEDSLLDAPQLKKKILEWRERVDELLFFIVLNKNGVSAPKQTDSAKRASDFLLEPFLIIQLPWQPVLLHQWLAAALMEVLIFEHKSVEFRHWPIPREIESCATDLLTSVKQLKERIVLGFAILSKQVTSYPYVERNHPALIMDHVVLPSLSTLQFLITGKAYNILKSLKKIAWSSPQEVKPNHCYLPASVFAMDEFLTDVFLNLCYNFLYWEQLTAPSPFPGDLFENIELENVSYRLKTNQNIIPNDKTNTKPLKPLNRDEKILCNIVDTNREHVTNSERVTSAYNTINDCVLKPGRMPTVTLESVKANFKEKDMRKIAGKMFVNLEKIDEKSQILLCSMIYSELYEMLIGSEKENSVLARIVHLQIEIAEREQIIRLTNILSTKFGISPVAVGLDAVEPMSIKTMTRLLVEYHEIKKSQTREWLWNQFSDEYRQPVAKTVSVIVDKKEIVKSIEQRVGRIILGIAQKSFDIFVQNGEMYKYWLTVQYIVPCYAAAFILTINNHVLSAEILQRTLFHSLKLLNQILVFYESKLISWQHGVLDKPYVPQIFESNEYQKGYIEELCTLGEFYRDATASLFTYYIGTFGAEKGCLGWTGVHRIYCTLQEWTNGIVSTNNSEKPYKEINRYWRTWSIAALEFFKNLYDMLVMTFKPPGIQVPLGCRKLEIAYNTDAIFHALECVFEMHLSHLKPEEFVTPQNQSKFIHVLEALKQWNQDKKVWRMNLMFAVFANKPHVDSDEEALIAKNIPKLTALYRLMKEFRCESGPTDIKFMEIFPKDHPLAKVAANHFIRGNFAALDNMIPQIVPNVKRKPKGKQEQKQSQSKPVFVTKEPPKKPAPPPPPQKSKKRKKGSKPCVRKVCRFCEKNENARGSSFLTCQKCLEDQYPDINYYCSAECREAWWKEEHMAEHLEFELGISDFSHLNLNK